MISLHFAGFYLISKNVYHFDKQHFKRKTGTYVLKKKPCK